MARVLIEVPTYDGRIAPCTSESLWRLDRAGHDVDYRPRAGYGCDMARNRIAADAIDAHYDYVLMVDNDIELPRDALANLIEHGEDIVLGYYLNRYARGDGRRVNAFVTGTNWQMFTADELHERERRGEKLVRVSAGGLGCALIRTSVFERMPMPWFKWTDSSRAKRDAESVYDLTDKFNSGGEDVNFCIMATAEDIPIYVDTRVACGHEFRTVHYA